ncbi:MAG TPA: hypothetical protein VHB79_21165 [Polyangiaceae bacterium]|nr:hypothetical protein [Polyangiaceae bacterium]
MPFLQPLEEDVERSFDHEGKSGRRIRVTHQVARAFKLFFRRSIQRQVKVILLSGKRLQELHLAESFRYWRKGESLGQHLFDLSFGLTRHARQQLSVIVWSQVVAQQADGGQVHLTALEHVKNHRKPPREARRRDAMKGFIVAEPQPVQTIIEQGASPQREMQLPRVHLGKVRHNPRFGACTHHQQP